MSLGGSIASSSGGGGAGGLDQGSGTAIADNKVVRGDTPDGLQGSVVDISDAGVVSGVTQLDVDNLRLDANTIATLNANGDLTIAPNGTGRVILTGRLAPPNGSAAAPGINAAEGT